MKQRLFRTVGIAAFGLTFVVAAGVAEASTPPGAVPFELQMVPAGAAAPRNAIAYEREGILYLTASDLSVLLDGGKFWRSELGRLTMTVGKHKIVLTEGTNLARVGEGDIFHLPGPVFLWEGHMMVPLDLFVDSEGLARPWVELPLSFSRETRRLEASVGQVSVSGAEIEQERTGWHLVIEAETPIKATMSRTGRSSFVIRFPGLVYDPLLFPLPGEHRWFQNLRLRNLPEGLELSFTPGPRAVGYRITHRPESRLEVFLGLDERDLREGKLREFSAPLQNAPDVRLVALDPGHGKGDNGARVNGGIESELAWKICMEVADRLTRVGAVDVIFTREDDENPSSLTRAETANRVDADLYISVHVHDRKGGVQAFVAQGDASDASPSATLAAMGFRSFGAGQTPYVAVSRMIARDLLDSVSRKLDEDDGGVLNEFLPEVGAAAMPAILLEFGSEDEWTRQKIKQAGEGIVEGLRLYLEKGR